ncbi:sigma-70 family RNA polymerase sigma factor [Stieleria sp. TO1_6]|uniref:sigma-70 family RNA polymerase sigma factor n=1 Tax=Stieleria tagensis TaxID=2956795 RepID=UPI00209ABCC4|nr:sigma-70 family RNA polymerase sigma factor [Stieleria tagensis]MCO8124092.1 sigma-70 family RNA polymerase sigma factor [Stieleria tagensis]
MDPELIGKIDLSGVVQATMLEAFNQQTAAPIEGSGRLVWLQRVFMNNLLDELRKLRTQKRDAGREQSLDASIDRSTNWLCDCLAADDSTPSAKAARNEAVDKLLQAIAKLPDSQRMAIEMHHLQSLPLEQIAERLGKPKGAVAATIYRGMKNLRSHWPTSQRR